MKELLCDIAVVGSGPAGLAAAAAARQAGAGRVLIIERDINIGGILQQCIHPGFGLKYFNEELTGPEYAQRFFNIARSAGVEWLMDTTALEIREKQLICVNRDGIIKINFGALILAMGCRERTRPNLTIPGSRPSGIYTAGTAQKLINIYGLKIGGDIVILGSGDIGMIMARRLTLEGARVKAVVELMPYLTGLTRNKVQCLDDFGIPLLLSHTIIDIDGIDRVKSVTVAPVDEEKHPILERSFVIPCDTLLLSVGLIPENELSKTGNVPLSDVTKGGMVNQFMQTDLPYVFACGNVLHVNDLVDNVSSESETAGSCAARYIQGTLPIGAAIDVVPGAGIRYVCPQKVIPRVNDSVTLYFRAAEPGSNICITACSGQKVLIKRHVSHISPGTMEKLIISAEQLASLKETVVVSIERPEGSI